MSTTTPGARSAPAPSTPARLERQRRIDEAVLGLLREQGPAAVTMEAVAARAGVAKTTLYRRHPDRSALLSSTLGRAIVAWDASPEGDVRQRVRAALEECWRQLRDVLGPGGVAGLLRDEDPAYTAAVRGVLVGWADALRRLVDADREDGTVRADVDPDAVVTLLLGSYLGALLWHGEAPPALLEGCAELMWAGLVGPGPAPTTTATTAPTSPTRS
ncbi:TetR/AcrR family transcriptional regulator [Nocardioides sp. GY 10127]|uniref:TetR/AcrR family transcriptional regulator n=1 Tax=Nocardioides sp. GY 10127 TaxID=2569762 RepID=UPI0010A75598|nr:TetR/AcrR family transcriptional regulator [Nocardioides sp. GY 10127]TIC81778.1 TetR/AcrR family transcriptional regulator [Nocardioides sp. GY 10127]